MVSKPFHAVNDKQRIDNENNKNLPKSGHPSVVTRQRQR